MQTQYSRCGLMVVAYEGTNDSVCLQYDVDLSLKCTSVAIIAASANFLESMIMHGKATSMYLLRRTSMIFSALLPLFSVPDVSL